MPTHLSGPNGQVEPIANIRSAEKMDVADVRTMREQGVPGSVSNAWLGGTPQTVRAPQTKWVISLTHANAAPAIKWEYATATLRNDAYDDIITALTA